MVKSARSSSLILTVILIALVAALFIVWRSPWRTEQSGPRVASAPQSQHRFILPATGFSNPALSTKRSSAIVSASTATPVPTETPAGVTYRSSVRVPYGTTVLWSGPQNQTYRLRVSLPELPDGPPTVCFAREDGSNAVNLGMHSVAGSYVWDTAPYVDNIMLGIIRVTLDPNEVLIEVTEGVLIIDP